MSTSQLKPGTTYPAIVGQILVSYRETSPFEQAQLAQAVELSQSTWSRIERGESALTVEQLAKAAAALNTTAGEILAEADRAAAGLRKQGMNVLLTRPKSPVETGLAIIAVGALALLIARVLSK